MQNDERVDDHVEAHEVIETGVLEPEKLGKVGGPIEVGVQGTNLACAMSTFAQM